MSKYVKNLLSQDLSNRLQGVEDCVLVNMIGLDANASVALRKRFRDKDIQVMVIKNSLAQRATAGTSLAPAFEGLTGPAAVIWGAEDFVSLVKEVMEVDKSDEFDSFEARGGVLDGEPLTAERVHEVSRWPSRAEQLSLLSGQLTSAWSTLQSQLTAPGAQLASQIEQKASDSEGES